MKKYARIIAWLCTLAILVACAVAISGCTGKNDATEPSDKATEPVGAGPFKVTFDLNGTELRTTKIQPQTVEKGQTLREPEVVIIGENPQNWYIQGWYMEPECENGWDFDIDIVESDMTLYAKWKSDPQVNVTYIAGKDTASLQQVYVGKVSLGLSAEKCDDKIKGYEVLGYYADENFETEYDFDAPVNEDINIYVKISDYIYLSPSYLSTYNMNGVSHSMAADGSSIRLNYTAAWNEKENRYIGDTFIFNKEMNLATNGYDHLEIVYKLENAERVNFYWFGTHSDGTAIEGCNDFSSLLVNAAVAEYGWTSWVDAEGWTHAVYDLTRVTQYYIADADRIKDIATIGGFRVDLDLETAENASLTVKYIKGSHGPEGANVTYFLNGVEMSDEFVPAGSVPVGYPRPGRKVTYYTDRAMTKVYDITKAPTRDIDLYVSIDESHIWFDGTSLMTFKPVANGEIKINSAGNLVFSGPNGAYIYHKELDLKLNGDNILEVKAKLNGATPGMYAYGSYTVNGKAGASTDFGQEYTRLTHLCQVTDLGNGWSIIRVDLTKVAAGYQMLSIDGLRLDIYGTGTYTTEIEYVKSYADSKHMVSLKVGNETYIEFVNDGEFVSGVALLGKNLAYYTDKAMTQPFDSLTPVTKDMTLYVKVMDHLYFGGPALNQFNTMGGAELTLNPDGTLTLSGGNGAFIHRKDLNLAMNGDNMLEIRVKLDGAVPGIFLYGKYTLNGVDKESTDYGQDHTRVPADAMSTTVDGQWTVITIDLAKMAPGFELQVLNGLRFDLYGEGQYNAVLDYIRSYCIVRHTVTFVQNGQSTTAVVMDGEKVTSAGTLGRKVSYFTDEACTVPFDINTPITSDITVYVIESEYIYFDGESLNRFNVVTGSTTLNADGTLTLTGPNGSYIYKKDLNLAMNSTNMMDIKLKMSAGSGYGLWVYGKYSIKGTAGESTDFGQDYTRIPAEAISLTTDGEWTIITVDFSKFAEGFTMDVVNGFRLDAYGNGTLTHTYHSVKSYRVDKYTVTYKGDVEKTETILKGETITGSAILGREVQYFTDEACTVPFDITTPITANITLYVKVGTHIYFNGTSLNTLNKVGNELSGVVNADGSVTLTGVNGDFIHRKGLNLSMNGDNMLTIKVKMSAGSGYGIWVFGKYTVNGVAGESTDYGQNYTRIPDAAITTTTEGEWTVLTIDLGKVTEGYVLEVMNGLRFDLYGNGTITHTYHSVVSYKEDKCTVTYKGDVDLTDIVMKGGVINTNLVLGREELFYTDEACTVPFDVNTVVNSSMTLYVKLSDYVYVDGTDIKDNFTLLGTSATATVNEDGNFVIQPGAGDPIFNWVPSALTTGGNDKFEVRFKLTGHGTQVALFSQGTLVGGSAQGEIGVYYVTNTDGWYTVTFDFSIPTQLNGGKFESITQLRFDVNGCTADTVIEIDYIKTVKEEIKYTVTYAGDKTGSETVTDGEAAQGADKILGREIKYFTDEAFTKPYDISTPITADTTIYVQISDYVYVDGQDIKENFSSTTSGTVNADGNFEIQPGAGDPIFNWRPTALTTGGNNKFEVRFKLTGHGTQVALFSQGTLVGGSAQDEIGVYYVTNTDGWYTVTFDFSIPTQLNGGKFESITQLRFDVNGCTADTIVEIAYIKTITDVEEFTVTYAGAASGTEQVMKGECAVGVIPVFGREELYYTDAACTVPFDLATPITGDTTLYVKLSDYLYFDGADLSTFGGNTGLSDTSVNESGNFVATFANLGRISNYGMSMNVTNGVTKIVVKAKITGLSGQAAAWLEGTKSDSTALGVTGVYVSSTSFVSLGNDWYEITFDFTSKLGNATLTTVSRVMLDLPSATAEIAYIKTVTE